MGTLKTSGSNALSFLLTLLIVLALFAAGPVIARLLI
jgi:hypothetical protein